MIGKVCHNIIELSVLTNSDGCYVFLCQVNHSQRLNEKPLTPWIVRWENTCCTLRLYGGTGGDLFPCILSAVGDRRWCGEKRLTDSYPKECILGNANRYSISGIRTRKGY